MESGTLTCPSCGAAVSSDSPQCQYCHTLLQTVACAKCMGMMFMGSKFCPHCGAPAGQIAQGGASKLACPRCHAALMDVKVANTPLDECGRCGGLWVDAKNFDCLCSDAETQSAALGLRLPPPVQIDSHVRYMNCPQCGKMMNRLNYAARSGVVMQVCRAHGIWLDRDEIRQIIEFIRAGGLTRARQIEKEQLQNDRAALELDRSTPTLSDLPMQGSIGHGSNVELASDLIGGLAAVIGHFI